MHSVMADVVSALCAEVCEPQARRYNDFACRERAQRR
jgi:hypothetical protein